MTKEHRNILQSIIKHKGNCRNIHCFGTQRFFMNKEPCPFNSKKERKSTTYSCFFDIEVIDWETTCNKKLEFCKLLYFLGSYIDINQ